MRWQGAASVTRWRRAWNFGLLLGVVALAVVPGLGFGLLRLELAVAEPLGLAIAVVAVTSGLGYALWYEVVPVLGAGRAAVAQLTVPVIAAVAGVVLLGEAVGMRLVVAGVFVLAGVALVSQRTSRSSGS